MKTDFKMKAQGNRKLQERHKHRDSHIWHLAQSPTELRAACGASAPDPQTQAPSKWATNRPGTPGPEYISELFAKGKVFLHFKIIKNKILIKKICLLNFPKTAKNTVIGLRYLKKNIICSLFCVGFCLPRM